MILSFDAHLLVTTSTVCLVSPFASFSFAATPRLRLRVSVSPHLRVSHLRVYPSPSLLVILNIRLLDAHYPVCYKNRFAPCP